MPQPITVTFRAMERVVSGRPVAEALPAEVERIGARRVFLLVSRTLNRGTDEIPLDALAVPQPPRARPRMGRAACRGAGGWHGALCAGESYQGSARMEC